MHHHILPAPPLNRAAATETAPSPAFYRLHDTMRITALSRSTIDRRVAEDRFPAPSIWVVGPLPGSAPHCGSEWIDNPEG